MEKDKIYEKNLIEALKIVAPGTDLRRGLDNVLRAGTGGLIVLGNSPEVMKIVEGGFKINCPFSAANLYELAKMDGAIILERENMKILYANAQLVPDFSIPSSETGIRHRTAEMVARQTGELVISISQRRNVISLYKGNIRYALQDISVILSKANQAIQTLDKYRTVLNKTLNMLNSLEFDDLVTIFDVVKVLQRTEMVMRIVKEIEKYTSELGTEGRLINMQVEELVSNVEEEGIHVINDYMNHDGDKTAEDITRSFKNWDSEDLLDLANYVKELGYNMSNNNIDFSVSPRGYRLLNKIPRLPSQVIINLINSFSDFQEILSATIEQLDDVEGIGEVRAFKIKEGLRRLKEHVFLERHI
ncbi:diadenylate cyclase [Desulfonispora thiosulfatigenes DSM 11270]|uniref:DNA integrity scanning protein DisA n=1 Tax=Desulfonispora thiosulfatigenes DSM 11270 TaxID=656914 RepID=A0A1W1UTX9_DESTI|nr:DNA integrity scanning diadenylate cyclase DisA [Desulfonispora thiosulfatigenes]SMB84496.1 diadenylate cyclase [Desulfonispora thiosulfatigenes DSM 11270]